MRARTWSRFPIETLQRDEQAWPDLCAGCGRCPTTRFPARLRVAQEGFAGRFLVLLGFLGQRAEWTTHEVCLPTCARCVRRAWLWPAVWAVVCVLGFALAIANLDRATPYDALGDPVTGTRRLLGLGVVGLLLFTAFLGPPLFFVLGRLAAPAVLRSWDANEGAMLGFGSRKFARAIERARVFDAFPRLERGVRLDGVEEGVPYAIQVHVGAGGEVERVLRKRPADIEPAEVSPPGERLDFAEAAAWLECNAYDDRSRVDAARGASLTLIVGAARALPSFWIQRSAIVRDPNPVNTLIDQLDAFLHFLEDPARYA